MKTLKKKTVLIIIIVIVAILLIMISGLFWKVAKIEALSITYGDWEFQRDITIKEDGESAFPIGEYTYDDSKNKNIPSYIISSLSLKSIYQISAADGLSMHELPSGAIVKYYIQPVYQQSEVTIKNMYTLKRCILFDPLPPKMKMIFTNLGEQKDFEEVYEAGEDGKYRYLDK